MTERWRKMRLRVGVIGTGRRGKEHLRQLVKRENVEVPAICDILPDVAAEAAKIANSRYYLDYREMLDKESLDAVVVATPAPVHADPTILAMEAGLAVLCEKPLAWSLKDALRIVDAAERTGQICETGYQWRHNPLLSSALEHLGASGIALVRGVWYHTIPLVESIRDVTTGGGQIFDQSTHIIDLARIFAGDIASVYAAYTLNARSKADFDDYDNWDGYSVTMRYESGAVGSFSSTYALFLGHGEPVTLDIVGSQILVKILGEKIVIVTPEGSNELGADMEGFTVHTDIIGGFLKAVAAKDKNLVKSPPADSIKSLATTIAANLSAKIGETVSPAELISRAREGEDFLPV
jgi:predicted dehydrogenase